MLRTLLISAAALLPAASVAEAASIGAAPPRRAPSVQTVGDRAVAIALRLRGVPYAWGGTTPAGFDCSGFTRFVWGRMGFMLPHSSYAQRGLGRAVHRADLRPGDLVFFAAASHVGIYVGHGRFIHAPQSGEVVSVEPLQGGWYAATYDGAVRLWGSQRVIVRPPHRPPAPIPA